MQPYNAGFQDHVAYAYWYPTKNIEKPILYLNEYAGSVAEDSPVLCRDKSWVVISHGSGGHRFNQHYLAEELARTGYHVLAIQHDKNNYQDNSLANDLSNLLDRPRAISCLLDKLQVNSNVTIIGHSFGGYAALVLAGAVPDAEKLRQQYHHQVQTVPSFQADDRVKRLVLLAPALSYVFSEQAMQSVTQPVLLITASDDQILQNSDERYIDLLRNRCLHVKLEDATHYSFLMTFSHESQQIMPDIACDAVLSRKQFHEEIIEAVRSFMRRHD